MHSDKLLDNYHSLTKLSGLDLQNALRKLDRVLDSKFEISYELTESQLSKGQKGLYEGEELDVQAFNTSYFDYITIFKDMKSKGITSISDLGCGYFRSGFLAQEYFPELDISGVELSSTRFNFIKDKGLNVYQRDLVSSELPLAQSYYIYIPEGKLIENIIRQADLGSIFYVIESHGCVVDQFNFDKRIKLQSELPLLGQRHEGKIYVFEKVTTTDSSAEGKLKESLLEECFYLIDLNNKKFIASSKDADFYYYNSDLVIELQYPKWTIRDCSTVKIIKTILTNTEKQFLYSEYQKDTKRIFVGKNIVLDNGSSQRNLENDCVDFLSGLKI